MSKIITTEDFIKKSIAVHGNKYDYSKTVYVNKRTKVIIIDPVYGEFTQLPGNHLRGQVCMKEAAHLKTKTRDDFIKDARLVHNNLYDYSKVIYKGAFEKVTIIDPVYGEFQQTPDSHLSGAGNYKRRYDNSRLTTEEFINRASLVHNNLYDYSKVVYTEGKSKVTIIDPIYGEFLQQAESHLNGKGNPRRSPSYKKTTEEFIKKAIEVHGNSYNYDNSEYDGMNKPITIVDLEYGEFTIMARDHLKGRGCPARYHSNCSLEKDHIIPTSLIGKSKDRKEIMKTAIGKLFDLPINTRMISRNENNIKSDYITLFGVKIRASKFRGDNELIRYLFKREYNLDIEIGSLSVYIKQTKTLFENG